jgi:hypothetical protein
VHEQQADPVESLAADFPGYSIWHGRIDGSPYSWYATRKKPLTPVEEWWGMSRTLMAATAQDLGELLEWQAEE